MKKEKIRHILVVSDPPASPGYLPRVRHLCEYLMQKGIEVTLLTEEYEPLSFKHDYRIVTIPIYSGGTIDWLVKTVWTLMNDWHNRVFADLAIFGPYSIVNGEPVDAVLCSAFSDFPLGAAKLIAEQLEVPLICDIRDLDEQVDDSHYQYHHRSWWLMPFRKLYRAIHIRRRNEVLRSANAITTVSDWHADFIRTFNANVHVVYNGYDAKQFYPKNQKTDTFRISYIGSLFEWQQPALALVRQAIDESGLPVVLDLHTPQSQPIPHDCLGDAIRQSSIMLVFTNTCTHGMLTTKFYEALGCEKPVLCVPSDNGSLARMIAYTHAGIATDDIEQIKQFIAEQYRAWEQQGYTRQATQHRQQFAREYQYDQFYSTCL